MFTNEIMLDKLAKRIKRELVKISKKSSNKRVDETDEQFEMRKNNPNEFLEEGEYPNLQTIRRRRNESVDEFARRKKYFLEFITLSYYK